MKYFINVVLCNLYVEIALEVAVPFCVRIYRFVNLISTHRIIKECSRDMSFLNAQVKKERKSERIDEIRISASRTRRSLRSERLSASSTVSLLSPVSHRSPTYLALQSLFSFIHGSHRSTSFNSSQ
jgi:hypothetical protein